MCLLADGDASPAVKFLLGDILNRFEPLDARVVHQDVDFPECLLRLVEQRLHLRGLADVGLHRDGAPTARFDAGDDLVSAILAGSVVHHHGRS
jgi:hypothetical protein